MNTVKLPRSHKAKVILIAHKLASNLRRLGCTFNTVHEVKANKYCILLVSLSYIHEQQISDAVKLTARELSARAIVRDNEYKIDSVKIFYERAGKYTFIGVE